MSLILGAVCDDGVVLAADSKTIFNDTKAVSYKIKKIHKVGSVAFGIAGLGYYDRAIEVLKKSINDWLIFNPSIHLEVITDELCTKAEKFLIDETANFHILLANSDCLYSIQAHMDEDRYVRYAKHRIEKSAIAGIEDVQLIPYLGARTTQQLGSHLAQIIRLNKGPTVGGRTQIVPLPKHVKLHSL